MCIWILDKCRVNLYFCMVVSQIISLYLFSDTNATSDADDWDIWQMDLLNYSLDLWYFLIRNLDFFYLFIQNQITTSYRTFAHIVHRND